MTMHTETRGRAPGALDHLLAAFSGLTFVFRRRKSLNQLELLDDRLLRDIGLTRFDVREMRRHW